MHTDSIAYEFPGTLLAERLGRNEKIIDRHDLPGDTRLEIAEVAIACEHDERCFDLAMRRRDDGRVGA